MWERIILGQPISKYGMNIAMSKYSGIHGWKWTLHWQVKDQKHWIGLTGTGRRKPFYLSYHWLDFETKKTVVLDGERSYMPYDSVKPGQEVEIRYKNIITSAKGNYILQIDMVHEGKTCFPYQEFLAWKVCCVNVLYAAQYKWQRDNSEWSFARPEIWNQDPCYKYRLLALEQFRPKKGWPGSSLV